MTRGSNATAAAKRRRRETLRLLAEATEFWPAQVARILGVTPQSVESRVKSGKLATVLIGGRAFVPKAEVVKWIDERRARADKLAGIG